MDCEVGKEVSDVATYWVAGEVCSIWLYEEYDVVGLALDDKPLARDVPPLGRRTPSDELGIGNPYPARCMPGGVGSGGAPDVPGSIVYARECGELGNGFCCALMVPND